MNRISDMLVCPRTDYESLAQYKELYRVLSSETGMQKVEGKKLRLGPVGEPLIPSHSASYTTPAAGITFKPFWHNFCCSPKKLVTKATLSLAPNRQPPQPILKVHPVLPTHTYLYKVLPRL